ncbi:MAG: hypothetical protein AB7S26_01920 [Sandaracinaceae bacterium]
MRCASSFAFVLRALSIGALLVGPPSGCSSCGSSSSRSSSGHTTAPDPETPVYMAGGVGWEAEEPLVYEQPDNDMRAAQYTVRGHDDAVLTVSSFEPHVGGGGDVQENLDRWLGQMEAPGGMSSREAANITTMTRNDLSITRVDLRGTFVGRRGMSDDMEAHPGWRLLGAIVEGGPEGLVFFKMTGPDDGVTAAEEAFDHMLDSVHPE